MRFFLLSFFFLFLVSLETEARSHKQKLHKSEKLTFSKGWRNPDITPSPPPSTMGKQMGTVNMLGVPPLGYEMDGKVKVFHLIAQPVEKWITDGVPVNPDIVAEENKDDFIKHSPRKSQQLRAWGYNGSTPGPVIEANEGDRIRIVLKNELPEPTSIHWHGIELPNSQDGAAGETQRPVLPGETFTYEYTLYQNGTFFIPFGLQYYEARLIRSCGSAGYSSKKWL